MRPKSDENRDWSPELVEARLRALPPPPVPSDLEARLLAAIPNEVAWRAGLPRLPRPRWTIFVGLAGAMAAAAFFVVLLWPKRDGGDPDRNNGTIQFTEKDAPPASDDPAADAPLRLARRGPDENALQPFIWPIQEAKPLTASLSTRFDLPD